MAKFSDFENPISGKKGNLFDLGNLWQMILGVVVMMLVFAMGEKVAGMVNGKVPGVSTQPGPFFTQPQAQVQVVAKEVI